jgi:hypothetical protein
VPIDYQEIGREQGGLPLTPVPKHVGSSASVRVVLTSITMHSFHTGHPHDQKYGTVRAQLAG